MLLIAIQACLSHVPGAIFSSMATVDTLCGAVGSSAFTSLYSATIDTMRGMAFLVIAAVMFMAAMIKMYVIHNHHFCMKHVKTKTVQMCMIAYSIDVFFQYAKDNFSEALLAGVRLVSKC